MSLYGMGVGMFGRGYWVHDNCMDVFIDVLKVQYKGPTYTKLKVNWMNKGFTNKPWFIYGTETIKIRREGYKNWQRYNPAKGR